MCVISVGNTQIKVKITDPKLGTHTYQLYIKDFFNECKGQCDLNGVSIILCIFQIALIFLKYALPTRTLIEENDSTDQAKNHRDLKFRTLI